MIAIYIWIAMAIGFGFGWLCAAMYTADKVNRQWLAEQKVPIRRFTRINDAIDPAPRKQYPRIVHG